MFEDDVKEPCGRYEVWHKEADKYILAAYVEGGNRLAALILPLINPDAAEYERVTLLVAGARATTIGDVIVNPDGAAYRIDKNTYGLCFQLVDFERKGTATLKTILNEPSRPQHNPVRSEDRGR